MEIIPFQDAGWDSIAPHWDAVAGRCANVSVFMSSTWIGAWWQSFAARLRPEVLLWRDAQGQPGAIAILSVKSERAGPLPVRAAYLNATGESAVASEHNVILCIPGLEKQMRGDLARRLRELKVDVLRLEGFRAGDSQPLLRLWGKPGPVSGFYSEDRHVPLVSLRLAGTAFLQSLSRNTREQINRSLRRYAQLHGAAPVAQFAPSAQLALRWFDELRELHNARWQARGGGGAFADPGALAMHRRLIAATSDCSATSESLAASLVRISAGEKTIGLLYNFAKDGNISFYQSGLCYETDARLKPGLVSHALAIQKYLDAGYLEYDFLAGETASVQYKTSLGSGTRRLAWLNVYRPTLKLQALDLARRAMRLVRRARARTHR